jgi:hypothetical protein
MKYYKILFLFLLAITGVQNLLAYEFDFNNWTEIPLIIMFERESALSKDFQIIKSGELIKHVWQGTEGGQCLRNTIKWAQWREPENEYKKWVNSMGRIPSEKQKAFGQKYLKEFAWIDLPIVMVSNEVFENTIKNAGNLVLGIDKQIRASTKLAGKSLCKSRVFSIVDSGQKDKLYNKPLLQAETVIGE